MDSDKLREFIKSQVTAANDLFLKMRDSTSFGNQMHASMCLGRAQMGETILEWLDVDSDDMQETIPTLAEWMDRWERALLDGQTTIGPKEAERRYYERCRRELRQMERGEG
jgi:flagellar capping protein FliD